MDFKKNLKDFEKKFGWVAKEQRSLEWYRMRLGVSTASNAKRFVSDPAKDTFKTYLCEKIGEVLTGEIKDEVNAKSLAWGKAFEAQALRAIEKAEGRAIEEIPFMLLPDEHYRFGFSPDGVCFKDGILYEIKAPFNTAEHVRASEGFIKSEYKYQIQFGLWASGFERARFCSYDPRMKRGEKLVIRNFVPDPKFFEKFDKAAAHWYEALEGGLARMGAEGSWTKQWTGPYSRVTPPEEEAFLPFDEQMKNMGIEGLGE